MGREVWAESWMSMRGWVISSPWGLTARMVRVLLRCWEARLHTTGKEAHKASITWPVTRAGGSRGLSGPVAFSSGPLGLHHACTEAPGGLGKCELRFCRSEAQILHGLWPQVLSPSFYSTFWITRLKEVFQSSPAPVQSKMFSVHAQKVIYV